MADSRPNIILMNCDDLGYGDLGCYGSTANRTPALDRVAAEGVRMTDFYMASPVCSPSRGAMMTGCYPPRIGFGQFEGRNVLFPGQAVGMSADEITVATLLRGRGYATAHVGKWHCGDQPAFLPTRHGFDEYFGLPYSNDMARVRFFEEKGRPHWPPLPLMRGEEVVQQQPEQASLTERYVEESVRFIRANRRRPFFLYFGHMHVHLPLIVGRRFLEQSRNGAYGAAVECVDWSVAVLMTELRRLGIDGETLFIFTSDNGSKAINGGSNGPLRGTKATTWEGGLRVPCLVRWPGVLPAGGVCREITTSMDFLPTLAGIAGAEPPRDRMLDGLDTLPLWREPAARGQRQEFFYYKGNGLAAVRQGRWKLHLAAGELYDLETDVGETTDVAKANAPVVDRLKARAEACREDIGDVLTGATGRNCRPIGRVANARPLTEYDPDHPYMVAIYDGQVG
jgi:arylsulfatase A-like enzyme